MASRGHRELSHTADLAFEVWASDLPGLYTEAVVALMDVCCDREAVVPRTTRRIAIRGRGREELLVRWLNEAYYLLESELWLTRDADELEISEDELHGVLRGEPFDADRHTLHTEIKAVTYHGLQVARRADRWMAQVIVDV